MTRIVETSSVNPWYNLAMEEYLFNNISDKEIILYLWQNKDTVVIGRNQNPWKECRCEELKRDGGKLARRLSGGGAVYHDLGNLNFTFIMKEYLYDFEKQIQVILNGIKQLGIQAEFTGRNDIVVQGKKISGNAFYFSNNRAYHHGTILVDTDFSKLSTYLQPSKAKIMSKGIDSVKSRVINLKELKSDITIDTVKKSIKQSFINIYNGTNEDMGINESNEEIKRLYKKYSSWEWRYGDSPDFDIKFSDKFTWGEIDIRLRLQEGYIKRVTIYSDAMNSTLIQKLAHELKGIQLKLDNIIKKIDDVAYDCEDNNIIKDIKELFIKMI
ncbi:Lipoate-protein ligase A [Caldisalinibacter kiritimatiensis]|uniref:lipoate--protein ligase n=2 Tax=Caldisalinibacter kiritimatiensis TaxID=1304284 RepID=R1CUF8_9FIRM|nr:Lipoate-protein ligase A [Caldisalinibacter kiritimatiensis]